MADDELSPARFGTAFKAFLDAMVAQAKPPVSPLLQRIQGHLGADPNQLPVITEEFDAFEHPNVQVALDSYLSRADREAALVGIAAENKRFMSLGLSDLLSRNGLPDRSMLAAGPVDYVNFRLADDRVLSCVRFGLYLIRDGDVRLVVFVVGPSLNEGPRPKVRVEVLAAQPTESQAFLAELTDTMDQLNVYRGQVISLSPGQGPGPQTLVVFHSFPPVTRDGVILPDGLLERVERHTVVFAEQADRLLAAGRSLKRGLLLYGPPGTGKTLTVRYLISRMPGRTVLLTTGRGMGMIQTVATLARTLAPSMVVLEDVDLIAEERGHPFMQTGPLLFELLNEMDGLGNDADVLFVLTTNRPDSLEPALAARPGRIDLAIEFSLPEAKARHRLLELYARGLELRDVDLEAIVTRTEGASPAYIRELLRKAAVLAATDGAGVVVTGEQLEAALAELDEGGRLAQRLLGFRAEPEPAGPDVMPMPPRAIRPTGFPRT